MTVACFVSTSSTETADPILETTYTLRADLLFERVTELTNNILRRQCNRLETVLRDSRLQRTTTTTKKEQE